MTPPPALSENSVAAGFYMCRSVHVYLQNFSDMKYNTDVLEFTNTDTTPCTESG